MTDNTSTHFSNRVAILADLWLNNRDDDEFEDFTSYNDIGLPLAYMLNEGIVESNEIAERFVSETFDLLLAGLDIEDTGFENLDEMLSEAAGE
jgi:hypothetical protein